MSAAVWRPIPMTFPPTSTSPMFPSNIMPTPHTNPLLAPSAAPLPLTVPERWTLHSSATLREELHAYIWKRRGDRSSRHDRRGTQRCYNCGEQRHLARDGQKNRPPSRGREVQGIR